MVVTKKIKRMFAFVILTSLGTLLLYSIFDPLEATVSRNGKFSVPLSGSLPAAKSPDSVIIPAVRGLLPDPKDAVVLNSRPSYATNLPRGVIRRHLFKRHVTNASNVVVGKAGKALMALSTTLVEPKANATAEWSIDSIPASTACPTEPPKLEGVLYTYKDAPDFEETMAQLRPGLEPGGHYHPPKCRARHRVAIIIPYRDRQNHLHVLLGNLHPMLMSQEIDYFILVVEMALPTEFNRGLLLNIGAVEALGLWDVHCFIFHDVDLIPENDHNLYTCPDHFRHMSVAIDKFKYRNQPAHRVGGVLAVDKNAFYKVNGFSNLYFGWGGEDNDLYVRLRGANMTVVRPPLGVARYWMFKHPRDKTNQLNRRRFSLVKTMKGRQLEDGLNSMKYEVLDLQFRTGYTWILVNVEKDAYLEKPKKTEKS